MSTITTDIELAIAHLKEGDIVAIPTETVYGLAGNAENEHAIKKIYAIKNRPINHPLILHVAENWDLSAWVSDIPAYAHTLIKHFWPGPLTLVMRKNKHLNPLITGNQDTVALRCPKHPLAQELLQALNFPLVAPSANPFGKISPTTAEHVQYSFKQDELLILDGGRCKVGIESTILTAINPNGYEILRHGLIDAAQINNVLSLQSSDTASHIKVPGKLASHYQPEKPLHCFASSTAMQQFCHQANVPVYALSFTPIPQADTAFYYQMPSSPEQVAYELYYQLRRADQSAAALIAIELPPTQAQWEGIRERLIKAAIMHTSC